MTRKNLSDIINYCEVPDETLLPQLEQITEKYPYCQTLWILLAAGWALHDNLKFQQNLPKIATVITNRRQLKNIVALAMNREALLPKKEAVVVDFEIFKEEKTETPKHQPAVVQEEGKTKSDDFLAILMEQLQELEKEISGFNKENAAPVAEPKEENQETVPEKPAAEVEKNVASPEEKTAQNFSPSAYDLEKTFAMNADETEEKRTNVNEKMALIDRFLEKLPTISRTTGEFFTPEDMIEKSVDTTELPVSETLATVLVQQKKYSEAIEIYQKLILEIPEKSSYFAAQIKNLSNI